MIFSKDLLIYLENILGYKKSSIWSRQLIKSNQMALIKKNNMICKDEVVGFMSHDNKIFFC